MLSTASTVVDNTTELWRELMRLASENRIFVGYVGTSEVGDLPTITSSGELDTMNALEAYASAIGQTAVEVAGCIYDEMLPPPNPN